ncbi:MAG TPA: hypothetical protein VJW20_02785 [Candidatus Angelobacter sp.]|nr:hypothetical protein [Candidatus Angelobacter sp.]
MVTSGSGAYSTSWTSIGNYTLTVTASGYAGTSAATSVNTGLTTTLDFSLHP